MVAIVESASWARSLNATVLWVSWLALSASLLALAGHAAARRGARPASWLPSFGSLLSAPWEVKLVAGLCCGIALVLGLIAALMPCTNYDSLTYHLPRVMHWLQNQSVAHYPTSDTRQLESGPWAGFVLANLCLLAGGLLGLAVVCIGWNRSRPLQTSSDFIFQPREQQYFLHVPKLYVPAAQVAGDIVAAGCQAVGLQARHDFFAGLDELEYPFWVLLRNRGFRGRLHHVGFTNESLALPGPRLADLDAVIAPSAAAADWSRRMPFHSVYESFAIHWSDRSSRWATLNLLGREQQPSLAGHTAQLRLAEGKLGLVLHSGRPGIVRLAGLVSLEPAAARAGAKLLVKSFAGHIQTYPLNRSEFAVEIPAPEGPTVLLLQLVSPQGGLLAAGRLQHFRWAWRPVAGPLPWAYLPRLRAGKGGEAAASSLAFRLGREPLTLEVVAGAAGQIELLAQVLFEAGAPPDQARRVLLSSPSGHQQTLQVLPGQNLIRAPVVQGTNALAFTWPDGPGINSPQFLSVTDLELHFR